MNKLEISYTADNFGQYLTVMSWWQNIKDHHKFDLLFNIPDEDRCNNVENYVDEEKEKEWNKRPIGRTITKALDARGEIYEKRIKIAKETFFAQKESNELPISQQEMDLFTF